jgi:hypothetical protein
MDFIFEDDIDEVGSDIEAYCPKCKTDTSHTVITKYEDEIRRVQCNPCGDVHTYRKPRGEVEEDIPEPVAAKKRAAAKKPTWEEARAKVGDKRVGNARPYSIRDTYAEGEIVNHPKFGVGFVTEISENKAEITFQDERRVLIHNRPDLAAQMPAIAPLPAPREDRKKKGLKGKKEEPKGKKGPLKAAPEKPAVKGKAAAPTAPPPRPPVKKIERVRAAVEKKGAAKGKPAAHPLAKKPMHAKPSKPARAGRPAAARRPAAKPPKGKKTAVKAAKAKKR